MNQSQTIPETFLGVGYTRDRAGLPLEAVRVLVPRPAADQVLIRVVASSLNPLEYKLADLNFMGRTPPVVLGLDLAGVVVAVGHDVSGVTVGDAVAAMADLNGDGGWAATGGSRGEGGYAVAHQFLTVRKPPSLSFRDAAALPICFLSAFAGLYQAVQAGDTVYVPGGGGGVGHLAVQMAAHALEAGLDAILAERGAKHVNVNLLRYFQEPASLDSEARPFFSAGWLWRWSGRCRDLWSRTSARRSKARLRRSMRDCSR